MSSSYERPSTGRAAWLRWIVVCLLIGLGSAGAQADVITVSTAAVVAPTSLVDEATITVERTERRNAQADAQRSGGVRRLRISRRLRAVEAWWRRMFVRPVSWDGIPLILRT